mgnify:CR=1 FL=1
MQRGRGGGLQRMQGSSIFTAGASTTARTSNWTRSIQVLAESRCAQYILMRRYTVCIQSLPVVGQDRIAWRSLPAKYRTSSELCARHHD